MFKLTVVIVLGFGILTGIAGWNLGTQHVQNQAVDHGFAHYNVYRSLGTPTAGFEWNRNQNTNTK